MNKRLFAQLLLGAILMGGCVSCKMTAEPVSEPTITRTLTPIPSKTATPEPTATFTPVSTKLAEKPIISEGYEIPGSNFLENIKGIIVWACDDRLYKFDAENKVLNEIVVDNLGYISNIAIIRGQIYFIGTEKTEDDLNESRSGEPTIYQINSNQLEKVSHENNNYFFLSENENRNMLSYTSLATNGADLGKYSISVINLNTGTEELIFTSNDLLKSSWSPDGRYLSVLMEMNLFGYPSNHQYLAKLYIADFDNPSMPYEILKNKKLFFESAEWNNDQSQFVVSGVENEKYLIYFIDSPEFSVNYSGYIDGIPRNFAWSPSGRYLLYEIQNALDINNRVDLYIFDLFTKESILVTEGQDLDTIFSYEAVWSPDEEYFAYYKRVLPDEMQMEMVLVNMNQMEQGSIKEFGCDAIHDFPYWLKPELFEE